MGNIEKALQDLENAVKSNDTVASVKVTITLKKPQSSKATPKVGRQSGRETAPRKSYYSKIKIFCQIGEY